MIVRLVGGRLAKFDIARWTPIDRDTEFANVANISISATGERVAFASGSRIVVQAFEAGAPVFDRELEGQDIKSLALNHDGTQILVGDAAGSVTLWDVATGVHIEKSFADSSIYALDWMSDGESIIVGTSSGTLMIIDKMLENVVRSVDAHATAVRNIAVQPTGEHVASLALDGTYAIWEASTLSRKANFHAELPYLPDNDHYMWMKFSASGEYLVVRNLFADTVLIGLRQMDVLLKMDPEWVIFPPADQNNAVAVSRTGSINLLTMIQ